MHRQYLREDKEPWLLKLSARPIRCYWQAIAALAAVASAGASIASATRSMPKPPEPAPPVAAPGIPKAIQSAQTPATTQNSNSLADLSFIDRKKTIYASGQPSGVGDSSNFGV